MNIKEQLKDRKFVILSIVLLLTTSLAGCLGGDNGGGGGDDAEASQLVIGSLVPLTGALEAYGPSGENAVALAVKDLNAVGGVNGHNVNHVKGDTGSSQSEGPTAAQNLVNTQGAQVVVGAYSSGVSMPVLNQLSTMGVPMISPASTAPTFTAQDDGNWFFRTVPSDALQGQVMANLAEQEGHETASVIYVNNDYGQGFADVFAQEFDGTTLQKVAYAQDAGGDYSTEVQQATTPKPDVVVFIGYPAGGSVIMQTAYQQGVAGPNSSVSWLFSEGVKSDTFPEKVGRAGGDDGPFIIQGYKGTTPQFELAQRFVDKYKTEYNENPALFADGAYDAAVIFALASEKCDCVGGQGLKDAMFSVVNAPGDKMTSATNALQAVKNGTEINYEGNTGVEWDENGDMTTGQYSIWRVTEDGSIEIVESNITP